MYQHHDFSPEKAGQKGYDPFLFHLLLARFWLSYSGSYCPWFKWCMVGNSEELEQGGARSTFQQTLKKKSVLKEIRVWIYILVSMREKVYLLISSFFLLHGQGTWAFWVQLEGLKSWWQTTKNQTVLAFRRNSRSSFCVLYVYIYEGA